MDVVPLSFRTLWLCGVWHDEDEHVGPARQLYRSVIVLAVFYFTLTLVSEMFYLSRKPSEFAEALFLSFTFIALCLKIVNFVARRREVLLLLRDIRSKDCRPRDQAESKILKGYARTASKVFLIIMAMALMDYASFVTAYVVRLSRGVKQLPYKTYQFYDTTSSVSFFLTSFLQILTMVYSVGLNVSFDTMTAGFLIMITAQFEINARRLERLGKADFKTLNKYVAHNLLINRAVDQSQSLFIGVVIPFFGFSLISVVLTMFHISHINIASVEFLALIAFAMCILFQVLVYCWFGNELRLKSTSVFNAAYNSDWTCLDKKVRRSLYIIMMCTSKGRVVSFKGQCSLTLKTFVWIVKMGYTTLSLLEQIRFNE